MLCWTGFCTGNSEEGPAADARREVGRGRWDRGSCGGRGSRTEVSMMENFTRSTLWQLWDELPNGSHSNGKLTASAPLRQEIRYWGVAVWELTGRWPLSRSTCSIIIVLRTLEGSPKESNSQFRGTGSGQNHLACLPSMIQPRVTHP